MVVKAITDEQYQEEVETGVSIVDFWATWCGPCRMQSPVLETVSEDRNDIHFFKVDVDISQETAASLGVRAIPTLVVHKDGKIVERLTGFHNSEQLVNILNKYVD
ncbi:MULTISPECIES: thioredoxin [Leuconostoc]|jgi:thioredoxin 1|uniref:thioredoxin n=1 Tax=Leuconostoc TaxID=1243 RepID=UPI00067FFBC6|nr:MULTISPECIES: thioredoxin [Leuconostoc]KMY78263.1 thioredoxin [Leuconostoc mesenteroides subsp. mesenteroides]MBZ1503169.1 thioredoxin [Leuconostoc mesenteroides]MBZ1507386.1 thioredoxin [Leuconostoc mesenteroides]MCH3952962.1 thioredoxin [Leuconostoc mesenteroides]MCH3979661.1 thioredoxin [Leuconostoc mesenteroides]